ncbi:1-deoxy-D-xylulose-5-phosphate reductoisomerase [Rubrobacter indicoceani]|uniref:1-deoxy-D-xylulose-5-phosphate reductoisomerase n=1 Tax=Rubrobacter indicoceani TaxID=2051957 RepID=UPI000E5A1464|nr:1-deoxy-D-xylulose-5-phosphate reductoisomerase [Rubrobacter indicoceani]
MTDHSTNTREAQGVRRVTVLGSTGSIGTQALDVIRANPDRFEVVGISASQNAELLSEQAREFAPKYVALENGDKSVLDAGDAEVLTGDGSSAKLAEVETDVVLNGVVGFAGLAATVATLRSGNKLALANKESIVAGGEWVMKLSEGNDIIPVDSEHSAIFQTLEGRDVKHVKGILLTASGGPFFATPKAELASAGPKDALRHPTWSMGVKNTLDSATMMNKGLEVMEAHHLFGVSYDDIKVVVHRQSVVHGGVTLDDGVAILHASPPDMRLPIAYGMLYPERLESPVGDTDFAGTSWTFDEPRNDVFRCLPLAYEAGRLGGAYPVALNAANEVAVEAFIEERIKFLDIADLIEETLEESYDDAGRMTSMEAIVTVDERARKAAKKILEARA